MEHPFSVRSWQRQDFAAMFRLLHLLGCNAVMIWPTPETALIQFPRQIVRKAEEIRWAQIFGGIMAGMPSLQSPNAQIRELAGGGFSPAAVRSG